MNNVKQVKRRLSKVLRRGNGKDDRMKSITSPSRRSIPSSWAGTDIGQHYCFNSVEDFEFLENIGKGGFGTVKLVRYQPTGELFALKVLKKDLIVRMGQVAQVKHEKKMAKYLWHPFIIQMFGSFQDEEYLYMVMEFVPGGDLCFYLERGPLAEEQVRFYAAELVLAVQCLHDMNIVYRDLKPENLILDANGHCHMTDMGLAKPLESDRTYTQCGTAQYLAPEVIAQKGHGKDADWWALGVLVYVMFTGRFPFDDDNLNVLYKKICKGKYTPLPPHISPEANDFLRRLLEVDPSKRLGVKGAYEVKSHKFFEGLSFDAIFNEKMWKQLGCDKIARPILPETKAYKEAASCMQFSTHGLPQNDEMRKITANFKGYGSLDYKVGQHPEPHPRGGSSSAAPQKDPFNGLFDDF
eukprot:Rmarinus@m.9080